MHRHSTIVNIVAYCAIAFNLGLWSRTRKEIQCTHFEHFTTLLQTSEYKIFNMKQCLSSMGLVRKLLFALQADWYSQDVLVPLFEALKVAARASFDKEDMIEPMVSYLAANLLESKLTWVSCMFLCPNVWYSQHQVAIIHHIPLSPVSSLKTQERKRESWTSPTHTYGYSSFTASLPQIHLSVTHGPHLPATSRRSALSNCRNPDIEPH